jgi:GTP-binding protein
LSATSGITIINPRYVASAVRVDQYPEGDLPEVAFVGRSNVGKSSLINSLSRFNGLARVSRTPGKTATLNYYCLTAKVSEQERFDFFLVDLPGYGYARTGQEAKRQWAKFIEEYLLQSTRLKLVCQLVDMRHPPMASDLRTFRWLQDHRLPVQVIATKADKISRNILPKHSAIIRKEMGVTEEGITAYSAVTGAGREDLLSRIQEYLLKIGQTTEKGSDPIS